MTKGEMDVKPLEKVMKKLREPGGCPWDRAQNHKTLRNDFLEEVYEFLETVDNDDVAGMREELGDVLLQVIFHARLEEEAGHFTMQDVVDDIVQKLIHRHPHVYGTVEVDNAEQVLVNWEKIKAKEKTERKRVLDGVTKGQPALMRAYKLQKKTAKVGFDWDNTADVKAKVREEITELAEAVAEDNKENMEWELGDVLFALTNYARHLGLEPEVALNKANNRFEKRFAFVEDAVKATGRPWATFSLKDLDKLWNDAKKQEKILKKGD
jgi:tetrapyrrole methylase family protein/MazG family protein